MLASLVPLASLAPLVCGAALASSHLPARLPADPALTPAAERTRQAIAAAARQGDFVRLEKLALAGRVNFLYDWNSAGKPGAFWRRQEAAGKPMLATLVGLLTLPASRWPERYTFVDLTTHPPASRASFRALRTVRDYHVTILPDGDWIEFVIGD